MKYYLLPFIFTLALLLSCSSKKKNQEIASDNLEQKAYDLAHKFIITDGHIDLPYRLNKHMEDVSGSTENGDFDYNRAKEGGLDAPFMSIYVPASFQETGGAKEFADSMINIVENMTLDHPDKFSLVKNPDDVIANFKKQIISFPMGMENGAPIEDELSNVKYFYDRGIRYITLTHGKDNQICDSSYDTTRTWNGLSPFGKEVVLEMNRIGIMVDVSHISDSTFYQVMDMTDVPVIASHSSCRYFTPGFERNMSDDMIKLLGEKNGVIQINFGSTFLDEEASKSYEAIKKSVAEWRDEEGLQEEDPKAQEYFNELLSKNFKYTNVQKAADHIDHVVEIAGIDHVGFGSDFDGVGDSLPIDLKDAADYPNLILELLKRGYSDEDIEKICYKNVFRVWNAVNENASN